MASNPDTDSAQTAVESAAQPVAVVLGRGRSGTAAERLLSSRGYRVLLLDGDDAFPDEPNIEFAVASPGIAPTHAWFAACAARGIKVVSELQLGVEALRALGVKMIAVTGSKGKSSVVKLVAEALGGVPCGNYGEPVCAVALAPSPPRWAIVEVSSFQLECTNLPHDAFEAVAILNLQEDHLDRHGSVKVYHSLKRKLLDMGRVAFDCAAQDPGALVDGSYFDNPVLRPNAAIAVALMRAAGLDAARIAAAFAAFIPLPHRMNVLGRYGGLLCIDDSKATNIAALAAALRMAPPPIRLIAGGLPKGDDVKIAFSPLRERAIKVYTIGCCAEKFAQAWSEVVDCEVCRTLEGAVQSAMRDAKDGETLLLSPGAASFDQFQNFGVRGDAFARLVKQQGKDTK